MARGATATQVPARSNRWESSTEANGVYSDQGLTLPIFSNFPAPVTKRVTAPLFNEWSWLRMLAKNDSEGLSGKHGQGYDD